MSRPVVQLSCYTKLTQKGQHIRHEYCNTDYEVSSIAFELR